MKNYGAELRYRRDRAGLTLRDLAQLIETSPTYVTDFENAKKSNPPDPIAMQRIATVLDWPVIDQIAAWGYQINTTPQNAPPERNPFPVGDRRHELFDKIDWSDDRLLLLIDDLLAFLRRSRDAGTGPQRLGPQEESSDVAAT